MGGPVSSLSDKLLVSRSNFFCGQESNSPTFTKKGGTKREHRAALRNSQEFGS